MQLERVGEVLSIVPKTIGIIIGLVVIVWFQILFFGSMMAAPLLLFGWDTKGGLFKSILDWTAWLCLGWR